jgi:DNA gyrase subunit B
LLCFFYRQMYQLVADGHVYVAQPPLFRVVRGKEKYYVQTDEEMRQQLLERGLSDATLEVEDERKVVGDEMRRLCKTLAGVEDAALALERRGIGLKTHSLRVDPVTGRLPGYHLFVGAQDFWFHDIGDVEKYLASQSLSLEPSASEGPEAGTEVGSNGSNGKAKGPLVHLVELHEVRTLNVGLKDLRGQGFTIDDLIPQERTGTTEPRFRLIREGAEDGGRGLQDLRELLSQIRDVGQKGLTVTRFKGLGEMNAEELRETTLDPNNRTLVKVNLADAGAADEMFRLLMGDKVEPRREFIEKHALDVRNLDV